MEIDHLTVYERALDCKLPMNAELNSDLAIHRLFAARFFNEVWTLIDKSARTPEEDLRMIHLAHASRLHWEFAGDASNVSIGEWQISRVYSVLGRAEPALHHARICLRITTEHKLNAFLRAYAFEAMARALTLEGDRAAADFIERAKRLVEEVEDSDDRALLEADLLTIKGSF